jgi:hypothetical protein
MTASVTAFEAAGAVVGAAGATGAVVAAAAAGALVAADALVGWTAAVVGAAADPAFEEPDVLALHALNKDAATAPPEASTEFIRKRRRLNRAGPCVSNTRCTPES